MLTSQYPCCYHLGPRHCDLTNLLLNEPKIGLPEFALPLGHSILNTEARWNFYQLLLKHNLHLKKLHTFKGFNWVRFDMCIHPRKHHNNQHTTINIKCFQQFMFKI